MTDFKQFELPPPLPPELNIVPTSGGSVLKEGVFKSPNYVKDRRGFQLNSDGSIEANDGKFRGTFSIGSTSITIDNTEDVPNNLSLIEAAGGGTLWLQNGTYVMTEDWNIPEGVALKGVSRDGVIIDCNTSFGIKIVGSNAYNTGTVTLNTGDTTVVGTGTTFTAAMVGRYVQLDRIWYLITVFTDTTHIDISTAYTGDDLSGASYTIADVKFNTTVETLTITNATASGLKAQYAQECKLLDIVVYGCGTGIELDQVTFPTMVVTSVENGVNLDMTDVGGFYVDFSVFGSSTTGAGVVMNNSGDATFFNSSVSGNTGDGINITNSDKIAFISVTVNANGGQGVEFVSGNSSCQLTDMIIDANASDGVKLTATTDYVSISSTTISNNGGYGVNIAASTCDNNVLVAPAFNNNTSGDINDLGTNTVLIPNTTVILVPRPLAPVASIGTASVDTNTTMRVYLVDIPVAITVNKISLNVTAVNTAGTVDLSVYTADGQQRPISVTSASISATGISTTAVSAVTLKAGTYFLAINTNSTTDIVCSNWGIGAIGIREVTSEPTLVGTVTISAGAPPTTFNPAADITVGQTGIIFRLDN